MRLATATAYTYGCYLTKTQTSVMEQPEPSKGHRHPVGVAGLDDLFVCHGATSLRNILNTQLGAMINRIAEREEGIGGNGDPIQALEKFGLFLNSQWLWRRGKILRPLLQLDGVHIALDVSDPGVDAILSLHTIDERQSHNLRMESEPPSRYFSACELHAVDTTLLSSTNTYHHPALGIANRVRL